MAINGTRRAMTSTPVASGPPAIDQRRLLVIIGALLLGMLLAALDQTIVATALPTITGDLHGLLTCHGSLPRTCWPRPSRPRCRASSATSTAASSFSGGDRDFMAGSVLSG